MKYLPPLLFFVFPAICQAQASPDNHAAITAERLKDHLEFVANDLMEGRDTPSRGLDITALYISTQLKLWGVKPGGDNGSYYQDVQIRKPAVKPGESHVTVGSKTFDYGKAFYSQPNAGTVSGDIVFLGHGWKIPSKGVDPFKGIDLKGKVGLVLPGFPKGFGWRDLNTDAGKGAQSVMFNAKELGLAGVVYVADSSTLENWDRSAAQFTRGGWPQFGPDAGNPPVVYASKELLDSMLEGSPRFNAQGLMDLADKNDEAVSVELNKTIQINVGVDANVQHTQNVVGILEGTDPKMKSEFVAMGAHYDHLGMGQGPGDQIYNGADDDGSGTVSVLEIAHAFATAARPRRSLIFVWHCGEEKGLWGSDYFTTHPTVPIKSIVAQLNIDMIGRSRPARDTNQANTMLTDANSIYVVGSRKISSELGDINEAVNASMHKLHFDYHYDAPNDPENIYQRSDHYNYARMGIPIAFFFDGVHQDYHRPSDEVKTIDFVKMSRVAQTVYGTARAVANLAHRPKADGKN